MANIIDQGPDTGECDFPVATIFFSSSLWGHICKLEGRDVRVRFVKSFQWTRAVQVTLIPKGKRKPRRLIQDSHVDLVILEGTGHDFPLGLERGEDGTIELAGRGAEQVQRDFNAHLTPYLARTGMSIAADYRGHVAK